MPYQRYLHTGLAGLTEAHDRRARDRVHALWANLPPGERPKDKEPLLLGFRGGKVIAVGCKSGDSYGMVDGKTVRFRPLPGTKLIEATTWEGGRMLHLRQVKE